MKKLILFTLFIAIQSSFAQGAATVLSTSNKVVVKHNGDTHALSRGSSVGTGDTIVTAGGAKASIKYSNGTLVNIGENSHYKILAFSPKSSDVQIKAELTQGSIASKTNGKTKESLKTPVIAMAILGTKYAVLVKSKTNTYVNVSEGHVKMGDTLLSPGESVLASPNGIMNTPFPDPEMLNVENESLDLESNSEDINSEDLAYEDITADEEGVTLDIDEGMDLSGELDTSFDSGGEDVVGIIDSSLVVGDSLSEDLEIEEEIELSFMH